MNIFKRKIITDLAGLQPYLIRWTLALPFGLSLKIHQILRADDDRCAHDHPWWMLRIILWGGYTEVHGPDHKTRECKPWRPWAPWRVYWCPATFRHRITELKTEANWSLVLTGGQRREWGFHTRAGWIPWRRFVSQTRADRVMWCDDSDQPQPLTKGEHGD